MKSHFRDCTEPAEDFAFYFIRCIVQRQRNGKSEKNNATSDERHHVLICVQIDDFCVKSSLSRNWNAISRQTLNHHQPHVYVEKLIWIESARIRSFSFTQSLIGFTVFRRCCYSAVISWMKLKEERTVNARKSMRNVFIEQVKEITWLFRCQSICHHYHLSQLE